MDATEKQLEAHLAATGYVEPKLAEQMTRDELVARVHALEATLMPFAMIGVSLGHARVNLMAAGRGNEPAGGHWTNGLSRAAMTPSEIYFYQALTVRGRMAVETKMLADMEAASSLTKTEIEQAAALDRGERGDH